MFIRDRFTLDRPPLPPGPVIPLAGVERQGLEGGEGQRTAVRLLFAPVTLGRTDLQGNVQVLAGLQAGDTVVLHSAKALHAGARVQVVEHLAAAQPSAQPNTQPKAAP